MHPDLVTLLDESGAAIGAMPKAEVHGADTPLHLAFSVYVFDTQGRVLMTRRALAKLTWPGVWTNSCCGHVRPDESPEQAATRRLVEELALHPDHLDLVLPDFAYRATSAEGIVENEVCPVFVTHVDHDPAPAGDEVAEWTWAEWDAVVATTAGAPWLLSPWSALQIPQLAAHLARTLG